MISDGNVIVSETNATLLSLKSDISTSAHIDGIHTRVNRLSNIHLSFQSVVNEYHTALKKYQYDVEQAFGRAIRLKSPKASEGEINAALANAVGCARSLHVHWFQVPQEAGDANTNSIAKELLPKYPDLILLVDSVDALLRRIAFYSTNVQYTIGGMAGGVVQPEGCSTRRIGGAIFTVIFCCVLIFMIVAVIRSQREWQENRDRMGIKYRN